MSEQKDLDARGWWARGVFHLDSTLDREQLVRFFLDEYSPTPIVTPWNGGSGFYEGDGRIGMDGILSVDNDRFRQYRETIKTIMEWPEMPPSKASIGEMLNVLENEVKEGTGKKDRDWMKTIQSIRKKAGVFTDGGDVANPQKSTMEELDGVLQDLSSSQGTSKSRIKTLKNIWKEAGKVRTEINRRFRKKNKVNIMKACRDRLAPSVVEWVDAVVAIRPDGEPSYPPILGSGGIDGNLDYTSNFMNHVESMLIDTQMREESELLLDNSLFGTPPVDCLTINSIGQFNPGRAGGYNQGYNIAQKDFPINPWDFILTLEGTVLWASGIGTRFSVKSKSYLRSPFTVRARAVGYGTASKIEEGAVRSVEIWTPIWHNPTGLGELKMFLKEGHSNVGRRLASNGIEFAEAIATLGVDRGVNEFVRYSILKRRGDSYIALPVGHFPVQLRREADLLKELGPLLRRLDAFLGKFKNIPREYSSVRNNIDEAFFKVLREGGTYNMKSLVMMMGRMERLLAVRDLTKDPKLGRPLLGLSPRWLHAIDDGTPEVRFALSLASIRRTDGVGPIRANLMPVDPSKPNSWTRGGEQVAWSGNDLSGKLASVLSRRMMDADRLGSKTNPTWGAIGLPIVDIQDFIEGNVDDRAIEDILFGLMWVKWHEREPLIEARDILYRRWSSLKRTCPIPRCWALLKMLFLSGPLKMEEGSSIIIRQEPSILPLLRSGRVKDACIVARRRLFFAGLTPMKAIFPDRDDGARIAAALLFPITDHKKIMTMILMKGAKEEK